MSLNGRLKARAASFARTAYPPILGSLRRVLSERQLQRFILVCDRLKGWLLKEAVVVPSPSPMALPPWIVDEMKALARIEPALYPSAAKLRVFTSWKAPIDNGPAQLYRDVWRTSSNMRRIWSSSSRICSVVALTWESCIMCGYAPRWA